MTATIEGRLDARAEVDKFDGNYRRVVQGVNDTLYAMIGPLNVSAEYMERISKGDMPEKITDDKKEVTGALEQNLGYLKLPSRRNRGNRGEKLSYERTDRALKTC